MVLEGGTGNLLKTNGRDDFEVLHARYFIPEMIKVFSLRKLYNGCRDWVTHHPGLIWQVACEMKSVLHRLRR